MLITMIDTESEKLKIVSTKAIKITYWSTTGIFSAMMFASAIMYLTVPMMGETFKHLGFPAYFRIELAIFKIAGAVGLLLPMSLRLKEWAYAGFFITLVSASVAHISSGDGPDRVLGPIVFGVLLFASYFTFHKQNRVTSKIEHRTSVGSDR
jgi:hypothetical protein